MLQENFRQSNFQVSFYWLIDLLNIIRKKSLEISEDNEIETYKLLDVFCFIYLLCVIFFAIRVFSIIKGHLLHSSVLLAAFLINLKWKIHL